MILSLILIRFKRVQRWSFFSKRLHHFDIFSNEKCITNSLLLLISLVLTIFDFAKIVTKNSSVVDPVIISIVSFSFMVLGQ